MIAITRKERASRDRAKVSNEELCVRAQAGDVAAREQLVKQNMGLCYMVARKYANQRHSEDDLAQEGAIHLLRVINQFDPTRGAKFTTIAVFSLRRKIKHRSRFGGVIAFSPSQTVKGSSKLEADKDRAAQLTWMDGKERPFGDTRPDNTERWARLEMQRELLECGLLQLSDREQFIIRATMEGSTLEQIGKAIGLTKERVRQIKERAMQRLQSLLHVRQSEFQNAS